MADLDTLVQERVFGGPGKAAYEYSTDPSEAAKVVTRVTQTWEQTFLKREIETGLWVCGFEKRSGERVEAREKTIPLAICHAALRAFP